MQGTCRGGGSEGRVGWSSSLRPLYQSGFKRPSITRMAMIHFVTSLRQKGLNRRLYLSIPLQMALKTALIRSISSCFFGDALNISHGDNRYFSAPFSIIRNFFRHGCQQSSWKRRARQQFNHFFNRWWRSTNHKYSLVFGNIADQRTTPTIYFIKFQIDDACI